MRSSQFSAFDTHMMGIALQMARRGLGTTAPNPSVGSVIADELSGEVIARGTTAPGGRPHAETLAIAAAGGRAKGATIYVTLEPCSHTGRTGPCADAIVAAGIKRAVVAIEDPDPRVAGRGIDRMKAAGIEVVRGLGASEARWITRGHIVRLTERRPFTTLKMALDENGDIARGSGKSPSWITGPLARAHGALLRAKSDAILIGSGTARDDDPELTCRLPGLIQRSPVRVVLSRQLDVAATSKLFASDVAPVWLLTEPGADAASRRSLSAKGAEIIDIPLVAGKLWLPSVMEALVARGMTRLLVEGGPTIWRAFAAASLVDEVVLFTTGRPDEPSMRASVSRYTGSLPLAMVERRTIAGDVLARFRIVSNDDRILTEGK